MNGETYKSRCHAQNAFVAVDYHSRCSSVPGTNTLQTSELGNCAGVTCPELPTGCVGVISHDSCCPQCGSHLTLLTDKELLKRNIQALGRNYLSSINVLQKLSYHISSVCIANYQTISNCFVLYKKQHIYLFFLFIA